MNGTYTSAIRTRGLTKDYGDGHYSGHDPLVSGLDVLDLAVLCAASVALVAFAALAFQRRDLRA